MAVGFDGVPFDVLVDGDGKLPQPIPDENGLFTYTASLLISSGENQQSLRDLHSKVTVIPAMAGGGTLVVERGPGAKHLIFPLGSSGTREMYAVLTEWNAHPFHFKNEDRVVDVTWILGGEIT